MEDVRESPDYEHDGNDLIWDGDVTVPFLALQLLSASTTATAKTVDSLALMAWESVRDISGEAIRFYDLMYRNTESVTTRKIEGILGRTPVGSWERTNEHARQMVESLGGTNPEVTPW